MNNINSSLNLTNSADELAFQNFSQLQAGDSRITSRTIQVASQLYRNPQCKFSQAFPNKAERKGAYRLVENSALKPQALIKSICDNSFQIIKAEKPPTVIIPGDTSTISKKYWRKTKGLGAIGEKKSSGFFFHSSLWLSLEGVPRGLVDLQLRTRPKTPKKDKDSWKHLPIEKKESYRWLLAMKRVVKNLPPETKAIFVNDREADIHEYFEMAFDLGASFVIRHNQDRRIEGETGKVREELRQSTPIGSFTIHLPQNGHRKAQDVKVELQAKQVTFKLRKGGLAIHKNREPVTLWAMRVFGQAEGEDIDWTRD
ncbi:MAG: transposase DNA-binding-containing protein [Deltaproteobacteria bacterium]